MKYLFLGLGFVFAGLALVGAMVPILPTTPFLLLAGACFARGSEKFHSWFMETPLYKNNIAPLKSKEGLSLGRKVKILALVTLLLGLAIYFMDNIYGRLVLGLVLAFHYIYFLGLVKTK